MKTLIGCLLLGLSLSAFSIEDGSYRFKGEVDSLVTVKNKFIEKIATMQVGGPGGVSEVGLVPFPTVCKTKLTGRVTYKDKRELSYEVLDVELMQSQENTEFCAQYVEGFKRILSNDWVGFTLRTNELEKL